ncbi:tripartite tricarboxylate transporter TctB family protein [Aquibacillus sp. 3ASR75-11]|uniref:Tripartite tricarboxylate transporter TctB family protein n=1 Tax=Terrihalobacillus insolitus TaxID=2950438 RepID=A0A9X3WQC9_9BACI|nr:tripartite tricarboxylate transporter TctB family protein [Terrihalobacillus insolitus]MDC3412015.1 tripartite tricarboxylate transporter TctB family protein [Terrihalobacillus insolitus]MDC3423300.1 tripartite tricarboxylate transporter TctB family protein [Terrihalobacillus insolitus]
MLKTINQKISIVLILLAIGYLIMSYRLPSYPYTPVDADVVPKGLGWLLIILSIFLFFSKNTETKEQRARRNIPKKEFAVLGAVFLFIFLYIWLLEIVGFVIMTGVFIFFCSWFLGYKKYKTNIIVSVLFPFFMYVTFSYFLKISLPQGILPF